MGGNFPGRNFPRTGLDTQCLIKQDYQGNYLITLTMTQTREKLLSWKKTVIRRNGKTVSYDYTKIIKRDAEIKVWAALCP